MRVTVIRHSLTHLNEAQKIQGQIDIPLSSNGTKLAHEIWSKLSDYDIDFIASSPLLRASQTAMIAASYLNYEMPIIMVHQFIERDFGELDYMPIVYAKSKLNHPEQIKGYELNHQFEHRLLIGLQLLAKYYPQKHVLVFCHSHVIKGFLSIATNYDSNYLTTKIDHQTLIQFTFDKNTLTYMSEIKKNT